LAGAGDFYWRAVGEAVWERVSEFLGDLIVGGDPTIGLNLLFAGSENVENPGDRPVDQGLGDDDEGDREDDFGGAVAFAEPGGGLFDGLAGDGDRGLSVVFLSVEAGHRGCSLLGGGLR
jgi:hypothetical protein